MSICKHMENKNLSRALFNYLRFHKVMNASVPFLKSNKQGGNNLQQNTRVSAQGTYLELQTWYPYDNSDRSNPAEDTVPLKVLTV